MPLGFPNSPLIDTGIGPFCVLLEFSSINRLRCAIHPLTKQETGIFSLLVQKADDFWWKGAHRAAEAQRQREEGAR